MYVLGLPSGANGSDGPANTSFDAPPSQLVPLGRLSWAGIVMDHDTPLLVEGAAAFRLGQGFFNPDSRPARDFGVLLVRTLAQRRPPRVLDLMAGCGLRSLRYGLEGGARSLWANDADSRRLPALEANLAVLMDRCLLRQTALPAQGLLADCLQRRERFDLVDLDAFGSPPCPYSTGVGGRGP